jgi:hypothetical protein
MRQHSNRNRILPFLLLAHSWIPFVLAQQNVAVDLKTAGNYVILAETGISTVPASAITGNIAVFPIASGAMTGFNFRMNASDGYSTSNQITGSAFAPDYTNDPGVDSVNVLTTAVVDMHTAYTDAAGRPTGFLNLGGGLLGGTIGGRASPLQPGVYTFGTGITIGGDLYLNGSDTDVFIFQASGTLLLSAGYRVVFTGGLSANNVFWQVTGTVALMAGSHMEGILLVKTDVVFVTGSSLNGRVFAQTACNLQMATIVQPPPESNRNSPIIMP